MYIIALSESKIKRKNIFDGISKVLSYSSIIALVLIVFGIIMSILLSFQNIFIFILLGLLALCFIAVSFIFTFGIIQLGLLNKSINDSFYYAWKLIKKRFWTIIGFMILLYVELYLLYLLIDWLYFIIFFYNETASIIIQILIIIIYLLYSINTLTIFTSKKNKKIGIK
jgi:hypothetical protein